MIKKQWFIYGLDRFLCLDPKRQPQNVHMVDAVVHLYQTLRTTTTDQPTVILTVVI